MTARFARVALPLPLAAPYTYRIPEALGDRVLPGARVVVPVRGRELIGIVVEIDAPAPEAEAREILAAPDPEPALPQALSRHRPVDRGLLRLAHRSHPQGHAPVRDVGRVPGGGVRAAGRPSPAGSPARCSTGWSSRAGKRRWRRGAQVPPAALGRAGRLARVGAVELRVVPPDTGAAVATERVVLAHRRGADAAGAGRLFRRRAKRRRLYEALESLGGSAPVRHVAGPARVQRGGDRGARPAGARADRERGAGARSVRGHAGRAAARDAHGATRPRRWPRSSGSRPADRRAALRGDRQRQDAGLPRGGAPECWREGGGPSCWCPRSGSRRRR